jgi:hypothetical protein
MHVKRTLTQFKFLHCERDSPSRALSVPRSCRSDAGEPLALHDMTKQLLNFSIPRTDAREWAVPVPGPLLAAAATDAWASWAVFFVSS